MFGKEPTPAEKQTQPKSTFSKAAEEEEDEERRAAPLCVDFIDSLAAHIAVIISRVITP